MASPSPKRRRINQDVYSQRSYQTSYMSPTKASLARFHPHLLSDTNVPPATTPRSKGRILLEQRSALAKASHVSNPVSSPSRETSKSGPKKDLEEAPGASPPPTPEDVDPSQTGFLPSNEPSVVQVHDSQEHHPSTQAIDQAGDQQSPSTYLDSALRQSSPILPTGTHDKASRSHDITGSPTTPDPKGAQKVDTPEPRLPSTPRQLGLEPPAYRPTGNLLFSPNQKGRKRPRSSKSSPLKPKDSPSISHVVEVRDESNLGERRPLVEYATEQEAADLRQNQIFNASLDRYHLPEDTRISVMTVSASLPKSDPLYGVRNSSSLILSASQVSMLTEFNIPSSNRYRDILLQSPDAIFVLKARLYLSENAEKVKLIDILRISAWASSELGAWLNAPIADRTQGAIALAIDRYRDMVETRFFCWYQCTKDFPELIKTSSGASGVEGETAKLNGDAKVASIQADPFVDPFAGVTVSQTDVPMNAREALSKVDDGLLRRKSCCFTDGVVFLDVTWAIRFTPSGEVSSVLSANAIYPPSWAEDTDQSDLPRIAEAFTRLIRAGKPVYEAIKCIIKVMFPS